MSARPTGIVTFLFTDVAASTRLWERDADAMARALERHDELCREHFQRTSGYVFATGGDGFAVAFGRASDALEAATGLQTALAEEPWPERAPLSVRMALHAGEAVERDGDYFGPVLNTAARLLAVGHAGQVLLSDTARQLVGDSTSLCDLGVHRLRDLGEPLRVWQAGDESFPALQSLNASRGNLPGHLPLLIGRDDELAQVRGLLSTHRLVTLTGVGGVGKTRLSLGLAGEMAPELADGAWLVDFAPRESDDDLAAAISVAIGAGATASDHHLLLDHLRERRMLLVLDNCEHVIDAAAELVDDLLAATNTLTVLVTSREPLGLEGEHVHRVRSLALPATTADEETIARSPAVDLFVERALDAGASPSSTVDLRTIAEICRHLDGIPLAIELAAARTRAMSPSEILARIDERFRLLGGGRRSRERHRTLTATVQWSHDLLTMDEQVVWRRLAVFVGGFDLDAAEAVVGRTDTLEALLSLVDKSMVQVDIADGRTRHSMLETLRQFAADRLADSGEVDEIRARHAEHYLQRYGVDCPPLRGPNEHETWLAVAHDLDNVIVAAERALEDGRAADFVEAATVAPAFWTVIAPAEGVRLLEAAVSAIDDDLRAVRALGLAAFLAWEAGDPVTSMRLALQHRERRRSLGAPMSGWAAAAMFIMGNFDLTGIDEDLLESGISAAEREDDDYLRVIVNALIATHRHRRGDLRWHESIDVAAAVAQHLNSSSAFVALTVIRASEELRRGGAGEAAAAEMLAAAEPDAAAVASTPGAWFQLMCARALFDLDRPKALRHLREVIRYADHCGSALLLHLGYEGIALARALDGRIDDASVLRAVSDDYFGADETRARGEVAEPIRERLDAVLADVLGADAATAARARARFITRQELLELALAEGRGTDDPRA